MKTSGELIREARERVGLTQDQLAAAASLASSTISRLERGTRSPEVDTLVAIAGPLRVRVVDLIPGESVTTDDRIPKRLADFLEVTPVTDAERRYLLAQAARDGQVDYLDALHEYRTPVSKRVAERPTTEVELPANIKPRAPKKR